MKKCLLVLAAVLFAATANVMYAQTTKSAATTQQKDPEAERKELKTRLENLNNDVQKRLDVAEDNLKKATADTKEEMQKAVDKLKKQSNDTKKALERANQQAKEDWQTVKRELNEFADKVEKELKQR